MSGTFCATHPKGRSGKRYLTLICRKLLSRELGGRVAALEAFQETEHEAVDEALILTISAAVAAYLGVKPRIRQIRLVSNPQWVQQGRATIQASRKLA